MLTVRLYVNAEEIGEMSIVNTQQETKDGAEIYSAQQTRSDQKLDRNGKPVLVKHHRNDGPWMLVSKAILAIRDERA